MAAHYPTFTDEELQNEVWKPIAGFEGYYSVSNLGRVRRDKSAQGATAGYVLKPSLRMGYPSVILCRKSKPKTFDIHRLVALAFLELPLDLKGTRFHVNHIDGCRTNSRVENLEFCTPSENTNHASRCGLLARGERRSEKLTENRVREIRERYAQGDITQREMAKLFNVCQQTIGQIVQRKTWRHVG